MEGTKETTALIYGIVGLILFLAPYVLYSKEFFGENNANKGNYLQNIGKVVGLHLGLLFFALLFTSVIDIMMAQREELSPSVGLKLFYGTDTADWSHLVKHLIEYTSSSTEGAQYSKDIKLGYQVVINYVGVIVALIMTIIPIGVLVAVVSVLLKTDEQRRKGIATKVFSGIITYTGVTFMVWMHALFASTYIDVFTGSNFSFYKVMTTFWHFLLLEGK